VQRPAQIG
jgi:thioredoxin reductase